MMSKARRPGSGGQNEMSSLESARRKFFMNSTNMMSTKQESNSGGQNEFNSH